MTSGELDSAERRALNLFDKWNHVTGFVIPHTGYYYELQSIIKDAVHCGAQQAVGEFRQLSDDDVDWEVHSVGD